MASFPPKTGEDVAVVVVVVAAAASPDLIRSDLIEKEDEEPRERRERERERDIETVHVQFG